MAYEYQEYPRLLYKGVGVSCVVRSESEKKAQLADGWTLTEAEWSEPKAETPVEDKPKRGPKPKAE